MGAILYLTEDGKLVDEDGRSGSHVHPDARGTRREDSHQRSRQGRPGVGFAGGGAAGIVRAVGCRAILRRRGSFERARRTTSIGALLLLPLLRLRLRLLRGARQLIPPRPYVKVVRRTGRMFRSAHSMLSVVA